MTDASGNIYNMLMLRNPWAVAPYTGPWKANDSRWTDALALQVPYSIDPRKNNVGIFVMPIE